MTEEKQQKKYAVAGQFGLIIDADTEEQAKESVSDLFTQEGMGGEVKLFMVEEYEEFLEDDVKWVEFDDLKKKDSKIITLN